MKLLLDHLVVAAPDLDRGAAYVRDTLGLDVVPGGRHDTMGTHNRLLGLRDGAYVEVIAIDHEAPAPEQPRWFGLDVPRVRETIDRTPCLIAWVARVEGTPDAIDRLHRAHRNLVGAPRRFARGDYRWRMAIPAPVDGHDTRRFGGVFPTLIQWDGPAHPTQRLASDAKLARLRGAHPDAAIVRDRLAAIGADDLIDVDECDEVILEATIDGPAGERSLR